MQNSLPVSVKVVPRVLQSSCPGYGLNCTGTAGQFWHRGKLIAKEFTLLLYSGMQGSGGEVPCCNVNEQYWWSERLEKKYIIFIYKLYPFYTVSVD